MKKRLLSWLCILAMVITLFPGTVFAASDPQKAGSTDKAKSTVRIGMVVYGDEKEITSLEHITALEDAVAAVKKDKKADVEAIIKYDVPPTEDGSDVLAELVDDGCQAIISIHLAYQDVVDKAADEYPDVQFVVIGGEFAGVANKKNFSNAYTKIHEARYVSGVVAGLKIQELLKSEELSEKKTPEAFDTDGNLKIGFVATYSFPEVVSAYTAYYLGAKSVVEDLVMDVRFTRNQFDTVKEEACAEELINEGCVVIGQYMESFAMHDAIEKANKDGKLVFSVGYGLAPVDEKYDSLLTTAVSNWSVYYQEVIEKIIDGKPLDTDWAKGYEAEAVGISSLGKACAKDTKKQVEKVEEQLKKEALEVFATDTFTLGGEEVISAKVDLSYYGNSDDSDKSTPIYKGETKEAIIDGHFAEAEFRSAPYFHIYIDGILAETEEEDEKDPKVMIGEINGQEYKNTYFGLELSLSDDWDVYTLEDLAEQNGYDIDELEKTGFEEVLTAMDDNAGEIWYYAENVSGLQTINLAFGMDPTVKDMKTMRLALEIQKDSMIETYEAQGVTVNECEIVDVTISGEETPCTKVAMEANGVKMFMRQIFLVRDYYYVIITAGTYFDDTADEILKAITFTE